MIRQNQITIDLGSIRHNYREMLLHEPKGVLVMPVVKANAYGHGLMEVSQTVLSEGAVCLAVAIPEEGIALRLGGVEPDRADILVLGAAMDRALAPAVEHSLTLTVFQSETVVALEKEAVRQGKTAKVHIKLDTGMGRIGLRTKEQALALRQSLEAAPHVKPTGIYTHFSDADSPEAGGGMNEYTKGQLRRFTELRACFPSEIPAHVANSAMSVLYPEACFSMVREGIALYGYPPVSTSLSFKRALTWTTEVCYVKQIEAGQAISYGRTFVTDKPMQVATVAVGYGDGYHRAASNRGYMLIGGHRCKILGRVCMDQTMVDVTGMNVAPGDEVVLIGQQGGETITAENVAAWADTISYEVLLAITDRVERRYVDLAK